MPKLQANQIFASSGFFFSSQIFCEHKNVIECLYFIYEWNTNMRRREKTQVYNSFMLSFSGIVISSHEWVAWRCISKMLNWDENGGTNNENYGVERRKLTICTIYFLKQRRRRDNKFRNYYLCSWNSKGLCVLVVEEKYLSVSIFQAKICALTKIAIAFVKMCA